MTREEELLVQIDSFGESDKKRFAELMTGNIVAAYIYAKTVFKPSGRAAIYEGDPRVRPMIQRGEIYVPTSLFSHLIGGRVEKNTVFVGERELDPSSFVTVGSGHKYVGAKFAAQKLGLSCRIYNSRLVVIGDNDEVERLDDAIVSEPKIAFAGASLVVDADSELTYTADDFRIAKEKWRESLVGSWELNDLSDPDIKNKILKIEGRCRERMKTMNRAEKIPKLWGDKPPVESCELREQYGGILDMARGYATPGCAFYRDAELAEDIKTAFLWMYEHMYGEAELEGRGWRSMSAYNWWDWRVGCGTLITDALLLTEELFTYEEKKKYLKVLEFVLDNWRVGDTQNFAAGRMALGPKTAIILEDPQRVERAIKDYHIMLEVRRIGEGTHTDYGNYQHGFPYNMMYGLNNLSRVLKSSATLAGTPLELTSTRYYDMYLVFKYMFEAAMYRCRGFVCFAGRNVTGAEESQGLSVVIGILPMLGNYGDEEDANIKHFVKYSLCSPELMKKAKAMCLFRLLRSSMTFCQMTVYRRKTIMSALTRGLRVTGLLSTETIMRLRFPCRHTAIRTTSASTTPI